MGTVEAETRDWWSEKGSVLMGRAIRFRAEVRAEVLLIVRRWWGIMSSFSVSERSSRSDMGMSSGSSSASSGSEAEEELSLSLRPSKSIWASLAWLFGLEYSAILL